MSTALHITLLALLPLLLAGAAMFSAGETALFSLTQADRLRLRRAHPRTFAMVTALVASPRSLLVTILLGSAIVSSAYLVASSMLAEELPPAGAAAASAGAVLLVILAAEIIPKAVASVHRVSTCVALAPMLLAFFRVAGPARAFVERFAVAPLVRLLVRSQPAPSVTIEDLSALLDVGARRGLLDQQEQRLLDDVVELSVVRVKEVMTPRVSVRWLDVSATTDDLLAACRDSRITSFPVCRGGLEPALVAGFVSAQDLLPTLARLGTASRAPIAPQVRPARYVPERARLDQLLDQFREHHGDIALCVNETGAITGLVTLDDVIARLAAEQPEKRIGSREVVAVGPGEWEVPGRLGIRDWADFFDAGGFEVPSRVSTVAGLLLWKLGRMPRAGEEVSVGAMRLRVERTTGRLIERVRVRVRVGAAEPAA